MMGDHALLDNLDLFDQSRGKSFFPKRFMNTQKFKLTQRRNRVYNNDVVSKQRIWQLILQKGIDDIKKVIFQLISSGAQVYNSCTERPV